MTNLDSVLKRRDITLPTKICLVKALVFPVVMYGCEYVPVQSLQSCPTLCDPMDCSLPGCSVHGILQARILEWVAISSPGDLPDPETESMSPALAGRFFTSAPPGKPTRVSRLLF